MPIKKQNQEIDELVNKLCENEKVSVKELRSGSRRKEVFGVRSLIAVELVKYRGVSMANVSRRVGVSTIAILKNIQMGQSLVRLVHNVPYFSDY